MKTKTWAVGAALLILSACAGQSTVQTVSQACGIYSSTLVSLSVYKSRMSQAQIDLVDTAIDVISPTCEGGQPEGDASDIVLDYLDSLEALLLEMRAI